MQISPQLFSPDAEGARPGSEASRPQSSGRRASRRDEALVRKGFLHPQISLSRRKGWRDCAERFRTTGGWSQESNQEYLVPRDTVVQLVFGCRVRDIGQRSCLLPLQHLGASRLKCSAAESVPRKPIRELRHSAQETFRLLSN